MRLVILISLLYAAYPAHAASFDCKKAASATERTICADTALSALDERMAAAYADAAEILQVHDDTRNPVTALFLRAHQDFSAARTRCGGATNCLLALYLRRNAILTFKPDPQSPSPLDPLIGRYATVVDPSRELVIMRAPGTGALVGVSVVGKTWHCAFSGIAGPATDAGLRVTRPDFDGTAQGEHAILLVKTQTGLAVKHAARDDVSARFCDAGGSLEQPFPRR